MRNDEMENLRSYLANAKGIAWDTCHKIYVLMDNEQMTLMHEYEYDRLISSDEMTAEQMLDTLWRWYEDSCELRFIEAVYTNVEDPNAGFVSVVPQKW
jgi:hypothetical protein